MKELGEVDWQKVFQLFESWQTEQTSSRDKFIARVRSEQPELYPQLAVMLQAHVAAEQKAFLADQVLARLAKDCPAEDWTGVSIGPWVLERVIGRGGMGQVWLATRGDRMYNGRAAVKMLYADNVGREVNERFAREGEFLARLTHPRIAQLYDAGLTRNGTRYLVIEYVEGKPLDEACDSARVGVEERLRLFLQVCEAVCVCTYAAGGASRPETLEHSRHRRWARKTSRLRHCKADGLAD